MRTRKGNKVLVWHKDESFLYGCYLSEHARGGWFPIKWTLDGKFYLSDPTRKTNLDIIDLEAPSENEAA